MSAILVKSYVGQAERYFEKELTNERENYYSEESGGKGQWTGKGAESLGLKGDIKKEDFSRLSRGVNPTTGERFRRITLGRTRETNGELKQVKEIAGWDLVISAPKSVSIAGLIGKDERVREAHREAVADALESAERQAQSNNGGGKKEQTNNLVVGRFSHDSARPSRDGFVAPQLHDHCFIMNVTRRADGILKPLESLELHRAQSYIKSVYYTGLADRLQKLGYAIEIDPETGAPEISGISKSYRSACSPRRTEILELAEKAGKNFRQLGLVNRREKVFDQNLIREQHSGIEGIFDYQAQRTVEAASKSPALTGKPEAAKESVMFALAKVSEREAVFDPRVVLLEANKRGIGQTSVAAIEAELETRKKGGQLKTVVLRDGREAAFLSPDEKIENELPQHIRVVQPKQTLQDEILATNLSEEGKEFANSEFRKLSNEQQDAVREILRAKTSVAVLEGCAGVGKTPLSFVNKMAGQAEYEVLGLAPTIGAAREFEAAQITSATLQKLLAGKNEPQEQKRFFIVAESSFVSSRQMDKFFREAVKPDDRILLVRDMGGHENVEAGKPSARRRREESASGTIGETVRRTETARETKKTRRAAVETIAEETIIEEVSKMRGRGQVREIKDRAGRHHQLVEAFIAAPEKSLIVAPRSADRREINSRIHEALKEAGKIGQAETGIKILRPRTELTGAERGRAAAYREGDVLGYTRGSAENKIAAKSLATVVKINSEQNLLTVEIKDAKDDQEARKITYNPKRLRGVSVWTEEEIKVSTGDRLQLRASFAEKNAKIADGTMLEVSKITADALTLTTGKGVIVKLNRNRPQPVDYGYASVSDSSRSKTIDRVLIDAETKESKQILHEKIAEIAISRAGKESLIFTDDAEKLVEKLTVQIEKQEITQKPEIRQGQGKEEAVEHAPQPGAIEPTVVLPTIGKTPTPEFEIQPAREKAVVPDAKPEVETAGRGEINPPVSLSEAPTLPTAEIKAQPQPEKSAERARDAKDRQEILIKEVLLMSRQSLAKQGIEPDPQAWKRFAHVVINDLPELKMQENQERLLASIQKDAPPSERVGLAEKTSLEATHAILKLAPENRRGEVVKAAFAGFEKEAAAERNEIVIEPEIKAGRRYEVKPEITAAQPEIVETAKTAPTEKIVAEEVKPSPKIRNFEAIEQEKLIAELVAAADDEARARTGENLSYSQEKRLTKMYRQVGDRKPSDTQINSLNALNERFSEPIPPPQNFIEATILKLDNMTEAEKSASLRGQMMTLDEIIKREELQKNEAAKPLGDTAGNDAFGRTDSYFTYELHRLKMQPEGKSYDELLRETQERDLMPPYSFDEKMREKNEQEALYQMGIANALREQMKRSLDEQGIKLEAMAQRLMNYTIDSWAKQQPTAGEQQSVSNINQNIGYDLTPENRLEAKAYIFAQNDERERDRISYSLAQAAIERAEEIKQAQHQEESREMEEDYETLSRGRSM